MVPRPPEWSSRAALRVLDERGRREKSNIRHILDESAKDTLRRTERGLSDEKFYARFRSDHWSPYECAAIFHGAKYALTVGVGKLFTRYTLLVYRHPWVFIIFPAVVCLLLGVGFLFRNVVTDHQKQFALPRSRSHDDAKRYARAFGDSQVRSEVIYVTGGSGSNLLNADFLNELWKFHLSILDLEVTAAVGNGEEKSSAAFSVPVGQQVLERTAVPYADEEANAPRLLSDHLPALTSNSTHPSSYLPSAALPVSDPASPPSFIRLSAHSSSIRDADLSRPPSSSSCAFFSAAGSSPSEISASPSSSAKFAPCDDGAPDPSAETGVKRSSTAGTTTEIHERPKPRRLKVAQPQTLGSGRLFGDRFWRGGGLPPASAGGSAPGGNLLQNLFPFFPFLPPAENPPVAVPPPLSPPGVLPPGTPRSEETPAAPPCVEALAHPKDRISGLACRPPVKAGHYAFSNLCWKDAAGICTPPDGVLFMYNSRGEFGNPLGYPRHTNWVLATEAPTDIWLSQRGLQLAAGGSQAHGTQGFALRYLLSDKPELRTAAVEWEHALMRHVNSAAATLPGASVYVKTEQGLAEDLSSSVDPTGNEDLIYVLIAALLIFIYIGFATFSTNRYRSKMLVSLLGGLAAALAYCGGAGLCYLVGLEHTTTATAAPFLVIGIGVDDIFIIINSYSLTYTRVSAKERLRITMRDSGLSITVTTLTNLISFAIGSTSPYLAIKNFCVITAAGLFAGYLMCITFFVGCLTIDARYEEKKRLDEVCSCLLPACCRRHAQENQTTEKSTAVSAGAASHASGSSARAAAGFGQHSPSRRMSDGEEEISARNDSITKLNSAVATKHVSPHMRTETDGKGGLDDMRHSLLNKHANTVYECVTLQVAMALTKGKGERNPSPKNATLQKFWRRVKPSRKPVQCRSRESPSQHRRSSQVRSNQSQRHGVGHPLSKDPVAVPSHSGSQVVHAHSSQPRDYESGESMEAYWTDITSQKTHPSSRLDHQHPISQGRHITNGSFDGDLVLTHQIPVKTSSNSTPVTKDADRKKRRISNRQAVYEALRGRLYSSKDQDQKTHQVSHENEAASGWGGTGKFKRTTRVPHEEAEGRLKNSTEGRRRSRVGSRRRARDSEYRSHISDTYMYPQQQHQSDRSDAARISDRQHQIWKAADTVYLPGRRGKKRKNRCLQGMRPSDAYNYEPQGQEKSAQSIEQKEVSLQGGGRKEVSIDEESDSYKTLRSHSHVRTDIHYSLKYRGGRTEGRRYPARSGHVYQRPHKGVRQLPKKTKKATYKRRGQRTSVRLAARPRCGVGSVYGSVAQKYRAGDWHEASAQRQGMHDQRREEEGGRFQRHYPWQFQGSEPASLRGEVVRSRILLSGKDQEHSTPNRRNVVEHGGVPELSKGDLAKPTNSVSPARKTISHGQRKRRFSLGGAARIASPREVPQRQESEKGKTTGNGSRYRGRERQKAEQESETSNETSDKLKEAARAKEGRKNLHRVGGSQPVRRKLTYNSADNSSLGDTNPLQKENSSTETGFHDGGVDEHNVQNSRKVPLLLRLFGRKGNKANRIKENIVIHRHQQHITGLRIHGSHSKSGNSRGSPTAPQSTQAQRHELLRILKPEDLAEPPGNVGRRWRLLVLHHLGRIIITPVVKLIILLGFAAIFAVAVVGCMKLKRGLDPRDLSRDGSTMKKFFDAQAKYFSTYGDPVMIFFLNPKPPCSMEFKVLANFFTQSEYAWFHNLLESRHYTKLLVDGLDTYLRSPLGGLSPSDNTAACMQMLRSWLQTPIGSNFAWQFIWKGDVELNAFQIQLVPRYYSGSQELSDFMTLLREDLSKFNKASVHAYNKHFIFYESDSNVLVTTLSNMAWAVLAVTLAATLFVWADDVCQVFLIMLPSLWSAAMVIFILVLIDVAMMGFMYYWDLPLNMLTMVNLIISIGFSIDYASHMCHTFSHCVGRSRDMRVFETLVLIGNPIFHGVMSTQLGVLVLAFTGSYVLRVFFKMMTLVLTLAFAHGAILLPVLLSLFGPMGSREEPLDVALTNFRRGLTFNRIMSKKYSP